MTTELTPIKKIEINLGRESKNIETLLSNTNINPKRFLRAAVTAVENGQDLDKCTPDSIVKACKKAAQDGLVIDNKEAALVKYGSQAVYLPMVSGLLKKAMKSPDVSKINARVVRQNDLFEVSYGLDESIVHKPNFKDPGQLVCAYAIARLTDGSTITEVMTRDEIMQVAASSKSGTDAEGNLKGIWKTWESEMWRKSVLKRLLKYVPTDHEANELINYDNAVDSEEIDITPEQPEQTLQAQPARTKAAAAVLDAEPIEGDII